MPRARAAPFLLVVGFFLAGCGSGSTSRTADSRPSAATGAPANPCGVRASTVPRDGQDGPALSLLETAEVARAECTDDVRFNFISSDVDLPPRYIAEYQSGPFIDFNQAVPARPAGNAFLVIVFEKAQASYLGRQTYRSRESIMPSGMHHLQEVRQVAAPENAVMFVIGLDEQRPFIVDGAPSPPHIVVQIV